MKFLSMIAVPWPLIASVGCGRTSDAIPGSAASAAQQAAPPFLVKPYLQWGDSPTWESGSGIQLLWQDEDVEAGWTVEYRPGATAASPSGAEWEKADPPVMRRIAVQGVPPHRLYRVSLKGLVRGGAFSYRVRKGGEVVFSAGGHAPTAGDKPYDFVVFGDCGTNTWEQRAIAYQTFQAHPDFVVVTGDIVYDHGRISEYREKFWPVYNAEEASPSQGGSTPAFDPLPGRARKSRYRDSRSGRISRRTGLLSLLGATPQWPPWRGGKRSCPGSPGAGEP